MKKLKEKFGQFALTREQMKMVKGGDSCMCAERSTGNSAQCQGSTQTCPSGWVKVIWQE